MTTRRVGLLTRNLMDRSKLERGLNSAGWRVVPFNGQDLPPALDGLLVDLEHPAVFQVIEAAAAAMIRCVAYGPHVNVTAFEKARRLGAHEALARSVVFRDTPALASRLN